MTCIPQFLVFNILIFFFILIPIRIFPNYNALCKFFKKIDASYDTPYYNETDVPNFKKPILKNNIYYYPKWPTEKTKIEFHGNTILAKYLADILFLKNKLGSYVLAPSLLLPITLLLMTAFFDGNIFFNVFICFTVPFTGAFIALEKFLRTQIAPYLFTLNPEKTENQKHIRTVFMTFYFATLMSHISINLLIIQLILGGLNLLNIIVSCILLGTVLFYENANYTGIFKKTTKDTAATILQIVIVGIVALFVKLFTNATLAIPILFLIPLIIILGIVLYFFTTKNLNILIKENVKTLSDKKYIGVQKMYDKEFTHIAFMDRVMPVYNRETPEERERRIAEERRKQEIIMKSYGFDSESKKKRRLDAQIYRARHAKIWLGNERVTPEEYDEFCRRYGYGKYGKKEEAADEVTKKEKEGGYVNDIDTNNATDRFNQRRR